MAPKARSQMIEETRNKLLEAARQAFGAVGYAQTSMDELTASAGLTRGALYHHFGDKKGLLQAVVRQLDGRGLVVRTGTLVDATVIAQASKTDGEAAWCVYGGPHRTAVKGYKAHVAADEAGGIVRRVLVTPANVHDSRGMTPVLSGRPGRVWADRAYDSHALHDAIRKRRGAPRIARQVTASMAPAKRAARAAWNRTVAAVRGRVEKIFGTTKRSYGLDRARYVGLERVSLQAHLTFLAYNLTRAAGLLAAKPA